MYCKMRGVKYMCIACVFLLLITTTSGKDEVLKLCLHASVNLSACTVLAMN